MLMAAIFGCAIISQKIASTAALRVPSAVRRRAEMLAVMCARRGGGHHTAPCSRKKPGRPVNRASNNRLIC